MKIIEQIKKSIKTVQIFLLGSQQYIDNKLKRIYGAEEIKTKGNRIKKTNKFNFTLILLIIFIVAMSMAKEQEKLFTAEKEGETIFATKTEGSGTDFFNIEYTAVEIIDGKREVLTGNNTIGINKDKKNEKEAVRYEEEIDNIAERKIEEALNVAQEESFGGNLALPNQIDDNITIYWKVREEEDYVLLIGIIGFAIFYLWKSRYALIKKIERDARNSVEKELPGFINKIVLLLNGGMIFKEAFEKIIKDYELINKEDKNYFYGQLRIIRRNAQETNKPITTLLLEFAQNIEVREFIKIATIIKEEVKVGGSLKEKLRNESQMLWHLRKKSAEERSKKAETNMTFPLAILLLVMMLITISPTFMEM